ncbi:MAG: helix-turn-helix transcriptional regulator [Syntrophomonas sp.]
MNVLTRVETLTGSTPNEISKELGITKAYYSMVKNGKSPVSKNLAINIHQKYGIPLEEILIRPTVNDAATKAS